MRSLKLSRKGVAVTLGLAVGAMHLFTGPNYSGAARPFVTGYLIDLVLPFFLVLLLGVDPGRMRALRSPTIRAALVFLIGVIVETAQFFNVPLFGRTFDPLDLMMYAIGVVSAVGFELVAFSPHGHRTSA
jgi:hypothetical protein